MTLTLPVADPNLWRKLIDGAETLAVSGIVALVVLAITLWAAGAAARLVRRVLVRLPRTREDATLQGFFASLARYLVLILGLIAVLTRLGVETTSVIAVLGAASLAVGLALQGTLSNVAAGVMLLLFRPYRVGDFVEVAGKQGLVRKLDLFTTELATLDNVKVMAPNGKIFGDFILNFTGHPTRRVDLVFHVDFTVDLADALTTLRRVAEADGRVLADPPLLVEALAVQDHWTDVALRVWTATPDYGPLKSDLVVACRRAFDAAGYAPAYPHQVAVTRDAQALDGPDVKLAPSPD